MTDTPRIEPSVMAGNPCPFLRGLAERGLISAEVDPLDHLSSTVAAAFSDDERAAEQKAVYLVALGANGIGPLDLNRNRTHGLRVSELRGGPLDKLGSGSRILNADGEVVLAELDRLDDFAIDCRPAGTSETTETERGLQSQQLKTMMDANFERAAATRRRIDRKMMDAEWPNLLRAMAKQGADGPYLSVAEVRELFIDRRLPDRVLNRIDEAPES